MASDNRASYAVIGFTVLAGLAAIVGALVYLGGMRGRGDEFLVETYYDRPVNGLSVGSDVNFRGVKVGKVREITFVGCKYAVEPRDAVKIYILMALKPSMMGSDASRPEAVRERIDMMVRKGVRVTVAASGITGMSRIEFDLPSSAESAAAEPAFVPTWQPEHAFVPSRISLLDSFSDSATKVMNQINRMDLTAVWSNVHASVESLAELARTSESMLASRQDEIEQILGNLQSTTESAKELLEELKRNPSLLLRESKYEPLPETE